MTMPTTTTTPALPSTHVLTPSTDDALNPVAAADGLRATLSREAVRRALKLAGPAVAGRSGLPVLNNVLLAGAAGGALILRATDLESGVTITTTEGVAITTSGATTLPYKLLNDIITGLPDKPLTIEHDPRTERTTLRCGPYEFTLAGIAAAEFPTLPEAHGTPIATVNAADLARALADVAFAAASDNSRPILYGVHLLVSGAQATLTATDGLRLARKVITLSAAAATPVAVLLPAAAMTRVASMLAGSDGAASIFVLNDGDQVVIATREMSMVTRAIDGTFPDVERVLPRSHAMRVVAAKADLVRAVKLAGLFVDSSRKLALTGSATGLTVSAASAGAGDHAGMVAADFAGTTTYFTIAMNAGLLADALAHSDGEQVEISGQSPHAPLVLRAAGDMTAVHLIMPMIVPGSAPAA